MASCGAPGLRVGFIPFSRRPSMILRSEIRNLRRIAARYSGGLHAVAAGEAVPSLPGWTPCYRGAMKTLLFCTAYLSNAEKWHNRYRRWLGLHQQIPLERDAIFMFDDASPHRPDDP